MGGGRYGRLEIGAAAALAAAAAGCGPGAGAGDDDGAAGIEDDIARYDALADELEANRSAFLGEEADEILARGGSLYWLEFPGFDPTLHRYDEASGEAVDYAFSIGGDAYNYRVGGSLVLTAVPGSGDVEYRAYDASRPDALLDSAVLPAPTDGTRWSAYATDGADAWIVRTDGEPRAERWTPGGALATAFTFADVGVEVGLFEDLDVEDGRMVFVESGRLWTLDLSTLQADWLENQTAVTGAVSFDADGVLYAAAAGLFYVPSSTGAPVDVGEAIANHPYRLNDTYATAHLYSGEGAALHGAFVVYVSGTGVFAYHLVEDVIEPILLEPRDAEVRVVYRNPQVLDDGTLFLQALESPSGSIGADGPIYRVDSPVLKG